MTDRSTLEIIMAEAAEVRLKARAKGSLSWTSDEFQRDLLAFLGENYDKGAAVIEVGCYLGGLSAQLAAVCHRLGWRFYAVDVGETFIETTRSLLDGLGLGEISTTYVGTLRSFAHEVRPDVKATLILIDGDHAYDAVREDIASVYELPRLPYAAAFHDFSLRHPTTGEFVDRAVRDAFGPSTPIRPIGLRILEGAPSGTFPTRENPQPDGHYWEAPGSEGAVLELPPRLPSGKDQSH